MDPQRALGRHAQYYVVDIPLVCRLPLTFPLTIDVLLTGMMDAVHYDAVGSGMSTYTVQTTKHYHTIFISN